MGEDLFEPDGESTLGFRYGGGVRTVQGVSR